MEYNGGTMLCLIIIIIILFSEKGKINVHIKNCFMTNKSYLLAVNCVFHHDADVTAYQVVARLIYPSEIHMLHVNQSTDLQTPVTLQVEADGEYYVTVFPVGERGIIDYTVEYEKLVTMAKIIVGNYK